MNKRKIVAFATAAVIVLGGGYAVFNHYTGNHINVLEVFESGVPAKAGEKLKPKYLDQQWLISEESKVYLTVNTSREGVNFLLDKVTGFWDVSMQKPESMKAEAKIDITRLNSGSSGRDNDVKGSAFFNATQFPEASFVLKNIEEWPKEWVSGQPAPLKLNGTITVKGKPKDVQFVSEALYEENTLKLKGETTVTFQDFGMKNPHAVVLTTENDVKIKLQLSLKKAQ